MIILLFTRLMLIYGGKTIGISGSKQLLVAFAGCHDNEFRMTKMFPEFLPCDVTFGVNKEQRNLFLVVGLNTSFLVGMPTFITMDLVIQGCRMVVIGTSFVIGSTRMCRITYFSVRVVAGLLVIDTSLSTIATTAITSTIVTIVGLAKFRYRS